MSAVAGRKPIQLDALADDELVGLARTGDESAFDAIVHRYRGPLVGYCRRWLDPHRAEEVVQHTFMKAFLCVRDDDRPLVLRPWLYRVAHNAALNALEKKGSDWEELDENYDGVPQPPQVVEQRARFLKVVDEIDALPARQREALLLNEFEGRCYADIASELGTSESGVRGLLRRARSHLREVAAALLPVPALRELMRADAARTLQLDRAGDLVGSAGAVGGAGVAGGIAKVAAGVLAAGTIASGGAAIKAGDEQAQPQRPDAPAASKARFAPAEAAQRTLVADVVHDGVRHAARKAAPSPSAAPDARPVPALQLPSGGAHGGASPGGIRPHGEEPSQPGAIKPPSLLPTVPLVPLATGPDEPAADEESSTGQTEETTQTDPAATPEEREQAGTDENESSATPSEETTLATSPRKAHRL